MKPALTVMFFLIPFNGFSASYLTEDTLIDYAQQNPHLLEIKQNQQKIAQTRLNQSGLWVDPRIEITQENVERITGTEQEISLWFKQDLMAWGITDLNKQATEQQNRTDALHLELKQNDWLKRLRQQFYQALVIKDQHKALTHYHQQLTEMASMVKQRWQLGDASKLDLLRIQNELRGTEADKMSLADTLTARLKTLSNLLNTTITDIDGVLLPKQRIVHLNIEQNPHLQLMDTQTNLNLIHQQTAAKQRFWPDLSLGFGFRQSNAVDNKTDGYKVGLTMSVPLFSQKHDALLLAQTETINSKAEKQLLHQTLQAELNEHMASLNKYRTEAETWQSLIKQQNQPMVSMAKASYQAGELSMTELLDVYRTELTGHKNYLNTAFKAREHYIQLQYLLGD